MEIFSVSELTSTLRGTLEHAFPFVWVRGEITNLSRPGSGHVYFALKDAHALLPCVWFSGQQKKQNFDPLTGEVYAEGARDSLVHNLQNGQELICAGALTVYPIRGVYQLRVEFAQETGYGRLAAAFEVLKDSLAQKGFFSSEHKKKIPPHPRKIALITAPNGAAIHDFLRIASERGCGSTLHLYPVRVQGAEAVPEIVQAIAQANMDNWAELIVLIRGGGSLQDLWAFNDESVATAIYQSALPILTGIGHEIDTSIADLVADLRVATPSHAAQSLWIDRRYLAQQIDDLEVSLQRNVQKNLAKLQAKLDIKEHQLHLLSPEAIHERLIERLDTLSIRLQNAARHFIADRETPFHALCLELHRARSFPKSFFRCLEEQTHSLHAVAPKQLLPQRAQDLALMENRLAYAVQKLFQNRTFTLEKKTLILNALNPLLPLQRGYALVKTTEELLIPCARETTPKQQIIIQWHDDSRRAVLLPAHDYEQKEPKK